MSLNITVTKKVLETIVQETFSNFGILSSSSLLDSLKLLGFYYATNSGISINIEDLKTPDIKKNTLNNANEEIKYVSQSWSEGLISDQERFQSIIDSWNIATESLKNRIVSYYQDFDPANNLYIMAFSGARGNMSQVRQLVGMRGLMSDQEGKIIDLPIQANFREGLSSIDYIISSYGARKGIVDTALKTADSGYLTRRLIYLAQDLVIREIDCKTKKGILINFKKSSSIKNLIGRSFLSVKQNDAPFLEKQNFFKKTTDDILTEDILNELKNQSPLFLTIRSSLTCESKGSICQKCYGWDLAHKKLIALGETVGIIAAQSIGEPGTQLTMRTFHTGGIFTGETVKQLNSPFSGKIIIPETLKTVLYRTNHGVEVLKLQQEAQIKIINWKGNENVLFLEIGSYLYIPKTDFVYKGQLIAEFLNQSSISTQRKLKPIFTRISGKVICNEIIPVRKKKLQGKIKRVALKQGILWIAAGKILTLPTSEYLFKKDLNKEKAIARLKIVTPYDGFINITNSSFSISNQTEKFNFSFSQFNQTLENCVFKIVCLAKNYQYIDKNSVIAFLYIYPNENSKIIKIEKKTEKNKTTFFITTSKNNWNIYGSEIAALTTKKLYITKKRTLQLSELYNQKKENLVIINNKIFPYSINSHSIISPSSLKSNSLKIQQSGLQIYQERAFNSFQYLDSICIPITTILNYAENDLVFEKKLFATLVNYTQQTDDIVQGLPKIEELIEARKAKIEAYLAKRPGIFLSTIFGKFLPSQISIVKDNFVTMYPKFQSIKKTKKSKEKEKKELIFGRSFSINQNILKYKKNFYEIHYFSPLYESFVNSEDKSLDIYYEFRKAEKEISKELEIFRKNLKWKKIDKFSYELFLKLESFFNLIITQNKKNLNPKRIVKSNIFLLAPFYMAKNDIEGYDYIIEWNKKLSFYLKQIPAPFIQYSIPSNSKVLIEHNDFIDIGEPLTDGMIDSHELLDILFHYHSELDGIILGTSKSLTKFQLILANSIQSIYQGQGVNISIKHIEIIVRQMTSKVIVKKSGDTPFLEGEIIPISFILDICSVFQENNSYILPNFEPRLLSATNSSLNKDGFLSAAGFQETRRILTKAAIEGNSDWLRGLKECIMSGKLIPAGSAFLNYKNYLDSLYYFKN